MAGLLTEEDFYGRLKKCLEKKKVQNTVVINGWKDNDFVTTDTKKIDHLGHQAKDPKEFDFLIVSEPFRAIFHIEVKTACSSEYQQKAAEQLSKGREFFKATIPFPEDKGWKYVQIMCFGKAIGNFNQDCQDCRTKFILGPDTDLSVWWDEITKDLKPGENISKSETYVDILKYLLHLMFKQEMCITDANLTHSTEEKYQKIEKHVTIFLSKDQLNVLHSRAKKVAFTSFYGTGKTTLLKLKAKKILQENKTEKVVIAVIEETDEDSILVADFRNKFRGCENKPLVLGLPNKGYLMINFYFICSKFCIFSGMVL
jgi:hypothetical protein